MGGWLSLPSAAMSLIELDGVEKRYGELRALKDVTLSIDEGRIGLLGPNGAGKSTLLRLVHGQVRPARGGTIGWPGLGHPRDVWELRRLVGWASPELQAAYVHPATVAECIGSGFTSSIGAVRALSQSERARVTELLRAFELEPLRSRPLTSLSYGQMRRTLVARALAPRPRVLLLDEPWEGLDPATAALVAERLRAARDAGTQLVCASHLGDRGVGLDHELALERGTIIRPAPGTAGGRDGAAAGPRGNSASEPRPGSSCRAR